MKFRHAVILAAGRGMRMMPLTSVIPKPMAPFDGTTLVAKGISFLKQQVDHVHITVGYKGAVLAQHVIEHNVSSVFNTEGYGNAWWLYNSLARFIDEPILLLTCDNILELDLELLASDYEALGRPACMVVPVAPVPGLEGDYIIRDGNHVTELTRARKSDSYCSGIQVLHPAQVNRITEPAADFQLVWQQLMHQRELLCSRIYPEKWLAIDTLEQLRAYDPAMQLVK